MLAGAAVIGFTSAALLIVAFTLPVTLPGDAHRVSAGMFTIGYGLAFLGTLVGGSLWDATGRPESAFLPALLAAVWTLALSPTLRRRT